MGIEAVILELQAPCSIRHPNRPNFLLYKRILHTIYSVLFFQGPGECLYG